jgi:hypothetical protein
MDSENQTEETQQPETTEPEVEQGKPAEEPAEGATEETQAEGAEEDGAEAAAGEGAPEADEEKSEPGETPEQKEAKRRRRKGGYERAAEKLRMENEWLKEQLMRGQSPQGQQPQTPAKEQTPEEKAQGYIQAMIQQGIAAEKERERQAAEAAAERQRAVEFRKRTEEVAAQHPDFEDAIESASHIPVPAYVNQAILTSERGPAIMYSLAKDPAALARISALPPTQAILEIGRLDAKLASSTAAQTKPKTAIRPPAPPTTLGGKAASKGDPADLPMHLYKKAFRSKG